MSFSISSTPDPSLGSERGTENAAATKIQSAFRGVKARQKVNAMREDWEAQLSGQMAELRDGKDDDSD